MKTHKGRPRRNADAPAAIGQKIELGLVRLTHDGRGIGSWQGRTVFVEGALPGEQVVARVTRARSKLIEARSERLVTVSAERTEPRCRHAERCGGCSLQHMSADTQMAIKQQALAQQLQHFSGVEPERWMPPLSGPAYGYRQRTRVALRWHSAEKRLQVGYRERHSSELVEVLECPILVPRLEELIQCLPAVLRELEGAAALGHLDLFGGDAPGLVVRHLRSLSESDLLRLKRFAREQGVSLWLQGEEHAAPVPVEPAGSPSYSLDGQGLRFDFSPGDFIQINGWMNQAMVDQALAWLDPRPGERVLDLYCGLGNFALPLAQRGAIVVGLEGSPEMVGRAVENAAGNRLEGLHFSQADLSKGLANYRLDQSYQAALLDPPRDGAEALVAALADAKVGRILYVSCNPATLARDAGVLAGRGYRLVQAGVMDMFPQTAHVEAMALFVSGKGR
jgi:23S rRNA (uracil1939-C5)-methyltransferase